jgi:Flp pilus assembly protein TadG
MSKRKNDAGQALVVVALGMVVLLGFMGLGLDMGYMRYQKRQVQRAADAAAIAAALELSSCPSAGTACSYMTNAASKSLTENGYTATITTTTQAGGSCAGTLSPSSSTPLIVAINNPPCFMGSTATDPHYKNVLYTEVVVAEQENLAFSSVFGAKTATILARAEAANSSGSNVMYALNQTASNAISLSYGTVVANGGVVDESDNSTAFSCAGFFGLFGLGDFNAPYIGVVGGANDGLCSFPGGQPKTHITDPSPQDPLAYLQTDLKAGAPSTSLCGSGNASTKTYSGSASQLTIASSGWTLNPGNYCGGIVINAGAVVTFTSGIYTLTSLSASNGGLQINAGTTVYSGNTSNTGGVGFYNYGPYGGINFVCPSCTAGSVTLIAPNATNCTGCASAWQGMLFYQDPGDTASSTVVGSTTYNVKIDGTSYFPTAPVTYALDFAVDYNLIVANTITLGLTWGSTTINTNFYDDFSALANGSPIKSNNATIVE